MLRISSVSVVVAVLLVLAVGASESIVVPANPCPQLFQYKVDDGGYYFGELEFPNDGSGDFVLEVNVSMVGFFRNKNIRLELTTPVDNLISGAKPHYHVHFPFQHVLPKLTRARFNGVVFCSGPPEPLLPGRAVTNMWAKAMLYTNSVIPTPERDGASSTSTTTTTTSTTTTSPTKNKSKEEEEEVTHSPLIDVRITSECGQSNDVQPLVVNGQTTAEGEFPWLVALMYRKGFNYEFRCTANLASDRHIITAAHCVQLFKAPLIPPKDMLVVLGKYNIANWANGNTVLRDVKKVTVHPSYEQNTGNYDIAVITLNKPVKFSRLIAPICLWETGGGAQLENIINKSGVVAGWGKDESGAEHVAEPKKVTLPVVSQETCLRSHRAFLNLTSESTFCAGNQDGKGPCTGDSGAGFMLKQGERWTLRGIVSVALEDPVSKSCDLTKFFIFADVAKVVRWVREAMAAL